MPVKITIKKGKLKKIVRDTGLNYIKGSKKLMSTILTSEMKKGKSPVDRGRWDAPYSESYKATLRGDVAFRKIKGRIVPMNQGDLNIVGLGKRQSPVNLKLSGQLHSSLKLTNKGFTLLIEFADKIAKYHDIKGVPSNDGLKFRRMLPRKDEQFNGLIDSRLSKILRNALRAALRKNK